MTGIQAWLVLVCAFSVALSNVAFSERSTPIEIRTVDEQEIYVVVVRHQMERWIRNAEESEAAAKEEWEKSSARSVNFQVFFVSIKGKDPSDIFLHRLRDIPRKIRKASNGQVTMHGVLDKETHQAGIINVADIRWFSGDAAEVHGGYWCGGRCGASILFRVQRKNSKMGGKGPRNAGDFLIARHSGAMKQIGKGLVVCVSNRGCRSSLELRKLYQAVADVKAVKMRLIRVVDESGKDYLYPREYFVPIKLPRATQRTVLLAE